MFCYAHNQLDDSFDEEFEVSIANYNLAQVAELEAARRLKAAALTQNPCDTSSEIDAMQIDSVVNPNVPNVNQLQQHHQQNNFHHQQQINNFPPTLASGRKILKRSCDCDNALSSNNAEFESSNKRMRAAF
ncbi:hypothetical protein ABW19_dt0200357 [Dactylella cylindrospora]|nr:hypothetical protein ABW19_dt0200357 [Dactylella cylindrospora]